MLATYFKRQVTCTAYYSGPAGPYLDEFTGWLAQNGYQHETIRRRLRGAAQLVAWAKARGSDLSSLTPALMNDFRSHLAERGQLLYATGQFSVRWRGAQLFFKFLQAQQIAAPSLILH